MKDIVRDKTITAWKHTNLDGDNFSHYEIHPASGKRDWITDQLPHMYRCLPALIANQNGWTIHLPYDIDVIWLGGTNQLELKIFPNQSDENFRNEVCFASSTFGAGIVTFGFDVFFKTEPGVNLSVRGTPNFFVDGAHPLEGLVETDWLDFTFTMNWQNSMRNTWC